MEKSESIKNIATALKLFSIKIDKIKKDATNPFFKSKYATLSSILESIQVPLQESDLSFTQFPNGVNGLTTILMHATSGEYLMSTYTMPVAKQNDPQAVGSAITYARRYALSSVLGLNIDDDDDANTASNLVNEVKVTEWLSEDQFKKALESGEKGILATLKAYDGKNGKGMKKDYLVKLTEKLNGIRNS